jgi:hypothetical protein
MFVQTARVILRQPCCSSSPAAEAIRRIVELLLPGRLIHFTACDPQTDIRFLDNTGIQVATGGGLAGLTLAPGPPNQLGCVLGTQMRKGENL